VDDFRPVWSPDGTKIAFASDRSGGREIYKMTSSGDQQTNLTNNSVYDDRPSWQPLP